ncbi:MAG: ATP-binding cassette domain-containing protein [Rubrivivax sp.]
MAGEANGADIAVELDRVTFRYPGGTAGIFDVSLPMRRGELVVCIGPSGCGKTTLLKLVAGFFRPESGRVLLAGQDVTAAPVATRGCGIVFQSYALFPHMRVGEHRLLPLRVRGVPFAAPAQGRGDARDGGPGRHGRAPAGATLGGRSSAWRWRARSPSSRARCCSTSRCRRWMRPRAWPCATRCGASRSCTTSRHR